MRGSKRENTKLLKQRRSATEMFFFFLPSHVAERYLLAVLFHNNCFALKVRQLHFYKCRSHRFAHRVHQHQPTSASAARSRLCCSTLTVSEQGKNKMSPINAVVLTLTPAKKRSTRSQRTGIASSHLIYQKKPPNIVWMLQASHVIYSNIRTVGVFI